MDKFSYLFFLFSNNKFGWLKIAGTNTLTQYSDKTNEIFKNYYQLENYEPCLKVSKLIKNCY